jgi:hypothetical protein
MSNFLPIGTTITFQVLPGSKLSIICHPPGALASARVEHLYEHWSSGGLTRELFQIIRSKVAQGTSVEMRGYLESGIRVFGDLRSLVSHVERGAL